MDGFVYLIRGFQFLLKPGIKRYWIIPAIINFLIFSLFFIFGLHFIDRLTAHFLPHWLSWIAWLLWLIFFLGIMVFLAYSFTIFANLIGAPFNSFLSEKVELLITGKNPTQDDTLADTLKDMPRVIKREWHKILYYLPRVCLVLVLYFIPVVNVIASAIWFVFSCWMMSIQYIDYPLDNRKTKFITMKRYLKKHWHRSLGFGCAVSIASMIPVVNFLVMPAAVIGGTLLVLDHPLSEEELKMVSKKTR